MSMERIGFMQGRLSPFVDSQIQAFPWTYWQQEFHIAEKNDFRLMEWTLDQEYLYENPLMTVAGQNEIKQLSQQHGLEVISLTGDCFMQAPFWKMQDDESRGLKRDFIAVAEACADLGISIIVVPIVDNGRCENIEQENTLVDFLESQISFFTEYGLQVVFESDYCATDLTRFIGRLDSSLFGINYDIGNSAALGFNPAGEIQAYGNRILNVHIKDRILNGTTVPLGMGNADFEKVFNTLAQVEYDGNYILQTARSIDENHIDVLCRYRDMTVEWMTRYAA